MRFALLHDGKFYLFEADNREDGKLVAECYVDMLDDNEIDCCWVPKEVSNEAAVGTELQEI